MNPPEPWVLVGKIGKAHGLDGSVRVWPEADLGEIFDNQVPLKLWLPPKAPERDLVPVSLREVEDSWIVRWESIREREETNLIRNGWIVARRQDLPEPKEDHVYWHDLIGAVVATREGAEIGMVREVTDAPAQTILEVECGDGVRFLLPLSDEVNAEIHKPERSGDPNRLLIHLPEGMIEATTVETTDRPRKRERRGQPGMNSRSENKE